MDLDPSDLPPPPEPGPIELREFDCPWCGISVFIARRDAGRGSDSILLDAEPANSGWVIRSDEYVRRPKQPALHAPPVLGPYFNSKSREMAGVEPRQIHRCRARDLAPIEGED